MIIQTPVRRYSELSEWRHIDDTTLQNNINNYTEKRTSKCYLDITYSAILSGWKEVQNKRAYNEILGARC